MSGRCRLLWSTIVLLSTGCQSLPSGPTALLRLENDAHPRVATATEAPPEQAESRESRKLVPSVQDAAPTTVAESETLPGPWGEDDVLRMVVEHEFKDASPADRSRWMTVLADASPDEVPGILAERRRQLDAGIAPQDERSADPNLVETKAQQIILTERSRPSLSSDSHSVPATTDDEPPAGLMTVDTVSRSRALLGRGRQELSAPEPSGFGEAPSIVAADDGQSADESSGFIANVFDVFGVGGDRSRDGDEDVSADSIQPAGPSDEPIRSVDSSEDTDASGLMDLQAPQPLQAVYWQEDVEKLIALLEAQVAQQAPGQSLEEQERYVRQHVALRMLYLIASRRPEALQAIPNVPHDEQEFWTQLFWALSSTFDDEAMPDSEVRAAETVAQLRAALRLRESRAALQLQHTLFCQRIDGFGDYVPFPENRFEPGQSVLIYTEVKNFLSETTVDGDFRTVLRSTVTVRQGGEQGRTMLQQDLPAAEDLCRSRRSDYFHSYRIQLPRTLQPGPHVLILEVTDALTGRTGQTTANFVVR